MSEELHDSPEIELRGLPVEVLTPIVEAALFAASEPLSLDRLQALFLDDERPEKSTLREILAELQQQCEGRGIELVEVASGYRYQVRKKVSQWVSRLWQERATRYSRALLETLVLIAYRQPTTRAEIEDIRGVGVSSNIMKTLQERGWVRVIGHRDVPGRPGLYATTREFLDQFNLKSLDQLPSLSELKEFDQINVELDLRMAGEGNEAADQPAVTPPSNDGVANADPESQQSDDAESEQEACGPATVPAIEAESGAENGEEPPQQ